MNTKLFAAVGAVALCAAVAHADVESANIVGYSLIPVSNGWSFRTVVFKDVAGGKLDLTKSLVKKSDGTDYGSSGSGSIGTGNFTVQKISSQGSYLTAYHYATKTSGPNSVPQKGWYEGGTNLVTNPIELNDGEGVIIYTNKGDAALLMSGGVDLASKASIPNGWSFSGNCTPVAFKLTKMKIKKSDGTDYGTSGSGSIGTSNFTVQKISSQGSYLTAYHYATKLSGPNSVPKVGWYKEGVSFVESESEDDITIEPGEGFIIYTNKSDAMIEFPSPITSAS